MKRNLLIKISSGLLTRLTSVKLTILLLSFLIITSIAATFIPQGKDLLYYREHFHPLVSRLILFTGFNNYFGSFLFLAALIVFTINLIVCMICRFSGEITNKRRKRFGPDLIHLGILVFLAGALITFFLKQEESFYVKENGKQVIFQKYELTLESFRELWYPDGRPREWISIVSVTENNRELVSSFPIEVNKALEFKGISVHQASASTIEFLILEDSRNRIVYLPQGHLVPGVQNNLRFKKTEKDPQRGIMVILEQWKDDTFEASYTYPLNSRIGSYRIKDVASERVSGLQVVSDPGFVPIICSFFVILAGLSLTFIQMPGKKK